MIYHDIKELLKEDTIAKRDEAMLKLAEEIDELKGQASKLENSEEVNSILKRLSELEHDISYVDASDIESRLSKLEEK